MFVCGWSARNLRKNTKEQCTKIETLGSKCITIIVSTKMQKDNLQSACIIALELKRIVIMTFPKCFPVALVNANLSQKFACCLLSPIYLALDKKTSFSGLLFSRTAWSESLFISRVQMILKHSDLILHSSSVYQDVIVWQTELSFEN